MGVFEGFEVGFGGVRAVAFVDVGDPLRRGEELPRCDPSAMYCQAVE